MPSKLTDYEVISEIGSGSYGKCVKVKRKIDNKLFVWKDMNYGTMTEGEKQQLVSEVNLLRELKHLYIVRYHDRIIDRSKSRLYLIMEFCSGGDLASLISNCRKQLTYLDENFIVKVLVNCFSFYNVIKVCNCYISLWHTCCLLLCCYACCLHTMVTLLSTESRNRSILLFEYLLII